VFRCLQVENPYSKDSFGTAEDLISIQRLRIGKGEVVPLDDHVGLVMSERVSLLGIDDANPDEAYARVLPEANQLAREQVRVINLDIGRVVLLAMAASKRLPQFEAKLRALPEFPIERFERLADYALALYSAHIRYKFPASTKEQLSALNEAAIRWRDILLAEAKSLVVRNHIKAELLKELSGYRGYRNVAHDVAGLAQIFKADWERIHEHTSLKREEIAGADQLALRLTGALGSRKRTPKETEAARDIQARMFTLLFRAYDGIRRAIQYVRGDDDAVDEIIPSLYSGRRSSADTTKAEADPPAQTNTLSTQSSGGAEASAAANNEVPNSPAAASGPRVPPGPAGDPLTYN
jgi:hypothetical protein